ncbi:hypothetical protein B9T19_03955 [Ignatzschineria sp. F8392]|uniref:HNH endonuclease n=1 Tax=Ignatzschineria sp. F8392 TaxID=1980117 RepID=UPI000B97DCFA|nr:HNH endonuclease [Ignatzschineria sp. F8392]OYQ81825.1 hypothetical protein B9T19_03955 [Ignatzschineria sp. F8392]
MKIVVDFSQLKKLANIIGKQDVNFTLESVDTLFEPIDIDLGEGISISANEVEVTGGLLSYKGRQILLYIKDHSYGNIYERALIDGKNGNKFHVANCKTLEQMMSRKRYQRYIATANLSGSFTIGANGKPDAQARLYVCQNCLTLLNYQQSRLDSAKKKSVAENFSLTEFFATYSSFFKFMPHYNEKVKVGYSDDWPQISKTIRELHRYTCQKCKVNLFEKKNLCHVHHINGVKSDNSVNNLEVLCADCHRREHDGLLYVKHSDMKTITRLRKEQGIISSNLSWDQVLKFADPALIGELGILRKNGMEAPTLGIEEDGKYLDIAWPNKKRAIALEQVNLSQWHVDQPGDHL